MGLWSIYKQRVVPSQLFVVACTLIYAVVTGHWEWQRLLAVFALLEAFSLLGAFLGWQRMRREERRSKPPTGTGG